MSLSVLNIVYSCFVQTLLTLFLLCLQRWDNCMSVFLCSYQVKCVLSLPHCCVCIRLGWWQPCLWSIGFESSLPMEHELAPCGWRRSITGMGSIGNMVCLAACPWAGYSHQAEEHACFRGTAFASKPWHQFASVLHVSLGLGLHYHNISKGRSSWWHHISSLLRDRY
jgi:hypothetical protein